MSATAGCRRPSLRTWKNLFQKKRMTHCPKWNCATWIWAFRLRQGTQRSGCASPTTSKGGCRRLRRPKPCRCCAPTFGFRDCPQRFRLERRNQNATNGQTDQQVVENYQPRNSTRGNLGRGKTWGTTFSFYYYSKQNKNGFMKQ